MSPASSHTRPYGHLAQGRVRQRSGRIRGDHRSCCGRDAKHKPASVKELALALPPRAWRRITWPGATGEKLSSRFSRVRVRVAHRDYWLADSRPEEWLLIEWPDGEK